VEAEAQLMMPPTPILKDNNWPLLTVTKGFFENLAQGDAHPSPPAFVKPTSGHYVNIFWLRALTVSVLYHQPLLHACKDCFTQTNSACLIQPQVPTEIPQICISMACKIRSKQQQRYNCDPRPESTFNVC